MKYCGAHGGDDLIYLGHPNEVIYKTNLRIKNTFEMFNVKKGYS